jgi:hypothetical protein
LLGFGLDFFAEREGKDDFDIGTIGKNLFGEFESGD